MNVNTGVFGFWCVRCGQPYDDDHPVHEGERLLSRAFDLKRRQDLLAGVYLNPCPVCFAGTQMWCTASGESLHEPHPERTAA